MFTKRTTSTGNPYGTDPLLPATHIVARPGRNTIIQLPIEILTPRPLIILGGFLFTKSAPTESITIENRK